MDSPVPELAPRLQKVIDDLAASDITPTHAEVVFLAQLRAKVDRPNDGSIPWIMGAPIQYAGLSWYPLHRLAESWYMRAFELLDGYQNLQIWAYLFAHIKSAPGDATLRGMMTVDAIKAALTDWAESAPIHDEQLTAICDNLRELDGDTDGVPEPPTGAESEDGEPVVKNQDNLPQFVAAMCKAYPGATADFWLTEIAAEDARKMLSSAADGGGQWATSPQRIEAQANWLRGVKWVWKNHEADDNG